MIKKDRRYVNIWEGEDCLRENISKNVLFDGSCKIFFVLFLVEKRKKMREGRSKRGD
jgi:hypothetical protein